MLVMNINPLMTDSRLLSAGCLFTRGKSLTKGLGVPVSAWQSDLLYTL